MSRLRAKRHSYPSAPMEDWVEPQDRPLIPELDYDPDEGEPPIVLPWESVHRTLHHDRPCPDYYTAEMKTIWDAQERWNADCPFCPDARVSRAPSPPHPDQSSTQKGSSP